VTGRHAGTAPGRRDDDRAARAVRTPRRRRDRGASTIELAMYMPLLLIAIFAVVQFSLAYLGGRAAQAAAREASRVARAGAGTPDALDAARARGTAYASSVGRGVLFDAQVVVVTVGADQVRATVTGRALQVVPGIPAPRVDESVQGPVEIFRPDLP
jgi:Flp pilus assembly protein TadG